MSSVIDKFSGELLTVKKLTFFSVVAAAVVLPFILMTGLACTYGTMDNILYGTLKYIYLVLILISFCILCLAAISFGLLRKHPDSRIRLPFVTFIVSVIMILLILFLSVSIVSAELIRTDDTPPQLILSESAGDSQMTGITLAFWTASSTSNQVEYGLINADNGNILSENIPSNNHRFQFTGLEPGKRYYYSLNGHRPVEFKAPPLEGKLRFAAAGDSHFGSLLSRNDLTGSMLENIKDPSHDYSAFFLLGDCVDLGFIDRFWKQAFNEISTCSSTIPVCYVIGNHDTLFGGVNLYRDYLCQHGAPGETANCLWKRIDLGSIHFLILDVEWGTGMFTSLQKQWLLEQLKDIPRDDWCIVMSHSFYYCSGCYRQGWEWYDNRQTIDEICPIFEEYDVDIVMSGHKHQAELLQKNGITYLVLGCFGGVQDPERIYISPASVWYQQGAYAFADITIDGNEATVTIRNYDYSNIFQTIINR